MRSSLLLACALAGCGAPAASPPTASPTPAPPSSPIAPPELPPDEVAAEEPAPVAMPRTTRPLEAQPLAGPLASLADFCRKRACDLDRPAFPPDETGAPQDRLTGAAGLAEIRVIAWTGRDRNRHCAVAIDTGTAWYVLADAVPYCEDGDEHLDRGDYGWIETADLVSGGAAEIVITSGQGYDPCGNCDLWIAREYRLVCGLGDSGTPSCTELIETRESGADVVKERTWNVAEGLIVLGAWTNSQGDELTDPELGAGPSEGLRIHFP